MNDISSKLIGTGVAVVTPFRSDNSIDYDSIKKLVNHVIDGGVNYIVVQGTTGESSTLKIEEKLKTRNAFLNANNGRVPLVLGLGGNDTDRLVKEIKNSDFNGFSAILSVVPYYNKPTQNGLFEHFSQIANFSKLPIILYNVPGRTSCNLEPETTIKLARSFKNIIGIKEAKVDIKQIKKLVKNKPKNFLIISGDDETAPLSIINGADGVISVAANVVPRSISNICYDFFEDRLKLSIKENKSLSNLYDLLFIESNPIPVKWMLYKMNMIKNSIRLPLVALDKKYQENIMSEMLKLKLL